MCSVLQSFAGHVVRRRDHIRQSVGDFPFQRRRRHQPTNPERLLHVPPKPVEDAERKL